MKVTNKLIVALALAVPLSPTSLVTADELVVKDNIKTFNQGVEDYSSYTQEAVGIIPMEFKDVIAVPPVLDKSIVTITAIEENDIHVDTSRLNVTDDVAFNTD